MNSANAIRLDDGGRLLPLANILGDVEREAAAAYQARQEGRPLGPITGLPSVDRALGGALQPGLHVVHGIPGSGKSAYALQVACSCQCPALLVTCEMAPQELLRRVTARVTGTYLGRLKSGEFPPDHTMALVKRAVRTASLLSMLDATRGSVATSFIERAAIVTRGDSSHFLLVVDSINAWSQATLGDLGEYEALNEGLASLRRIAAKLSCPVLIVAERNRASMKAGGLSAAAGSRRIEYGAESVMDLSASEESRPMAGGEWDVTLRFVKNRNGPFGQPITLRWNGALQKFSDPHAKGEWHNG